MNPSNQPSDSTCFPVRNSKLLPEFNDILISNSTEDIKNQASLESYFKDLGYTMENGKDAFNCLKNDDYGQVRYFSSAYITSVLEIHAKNCSNTKQFPILCKNITEIAKKTFDDFVSRNQCTGQYVEASKSYLDLIIGQGNQPRCFSGFYIEEQQCGIIYQH